MSDPHAIPERMYTSHQTVPLTNEAIADGLDEIGRLLPSDGRDHERRRCVLRAAELIRGWFESVVQLVDQRGVEGVHGLGIDYELSGIVTDWVRSGRLVWLDRLRSRRRDEVARLPSIGPRLAQELHDVLGVDDLDSLAEVARAGRLETVCGFGPKRIKLVARLLAAREATRVQTKGQRRNTPARASRTSAPQNAAFAFHL